MAGAQARLLPSPPSPLLNAASARPARAVLALPGTPSSSPSRKAAGLASCSFKGGSSLFLWRNFSQQKIRHKAASLSVRCEQSTKRSNGVDVWLGRLAMIGFATAITTEIVTGRGLLENFGLTTPLPTLALVVTALVGVLTAFFIFQSASRD